ncbi:nitroreductase family protein [Mycobacterium sp. MYCO198283]|uniref:nitroreductase family protein n=1 Tax=Mycobacterium sp. MYCO198283 TaxID=2883505 RepID=UPI001E5EDCC5|nr:nitroreductase family protein [Mycobacterium sp. MYCO198283]MCG5432876.1 nitroreductase family protein [Mycobacterium sp. MYCO198283]
MQRDRTAVTSVPIHPLIAQRWSPRALDPDHRLADDDLTALLEAARWSATWGRRQPVRVVVGRRDDDTFDALAATLKRGNSWARAASALLLVCADEGDDEKTAYYAAVDAGAAMANLAIEAVARGLVSHPMAGFDADGARRAFDIPAGVRPVAVVAIGRLGEPSDPAIAERDAQPRARLPLSEIAFAGTWGRPLNP